MRLFTFAFNCIAIASHGRRSDRLRGNDHDNDSLTAFLLQSGSQTEASHLRKALATSLLELSPAVTIRQSRVHSSRRLRSYDRNFPHMQVVATRRPKEGDVVTIKSTPNTRMYCPALIGTRSAILVDDGGHQPFQVEAGKGWLYEEDVEITGEQKDMMEGIKAREITKLANSDELQAKIEEAARENKALVIVFFASWCRACKATKPKFMKITKSWPQVEFCEILFDNNKELAKEKGIKSLPFFEIYTGDKEAVDAFQCGPSKIKKLDETLKERLTSSSKSPAARVFEALGKGFQLQGFAA